MPKGGITLFFFVKSVWRTHPEFKEVNIPESCDPCKTRREKGISNQLWIDQQNISEEGPHRHATPFCFVNKKKLTENHSQSDHPTMNYNEEWRRYTSSDTWDWVSIDDRSDFRTSSSRSLHVFSPDESHENHRPRPSSTLVKRSTWFLR